MALTKTASPKTPEPEAATQEVANPKKGRRWRVWADGDYCIYEAAGPGSDIPVGCLIPIPDVPHFTDKREADKFIENSGDLFGGKGLYIIRVYDILKIEVNAQPVVKIHRKEKIQVAGPETEDA